MTWDMTKSLMTGSAILAISVLRVHSATLAGSTVYVQHGGLVYHVTVGSDSDTVPLSTGTNLSVTLESSGIRFTFGPNAGSGGGCTSNCFHNEIVIAGLNWFGEPDCTIGSFSVTADVQGWNPSQLIVNTNTVSLYIDPFDWSGGQSVHVTLIPCECPVSRLTTQHIPTPAYDESCLDMELAGRLGCFQSAIAAAGGTVAQKTSACRSTAYQAHLYEVWSKFSELANLDGITVQETGGLRQLVINSNWSCCANAVNQINQEVQMHFPNSWPEKVGRPGHSRHEYGLAVDWTVTLPGGQSLDALAARCNLWRPLLPREPWHFEKTPGPQVRAATVTGLSLVNILVQDPSGRRIGFDPTTTNALNEIGTHAFYSGPGTTPQIVEILSSAMLPGQYVVSGIGTGAGAYSISLETDGDDYSGEVLQKTLSSGIARPGQTLATIPPIDCLRSPLAGRMARLGEGNILPGPPWATNAYLDANSNLAGGHWLPSPGRLDITNGLVLTNMTGQHTFFRWRLQ